MTSGELPTVGGRYVLESTMSPEGQVETVPDTEVWLAHDDVAGRPVALKLYRGAGPADAGWRDEFRARAMALQTLSHPGIATVYDHGDSDDDAWLVSALVRDAVPVEEWPASQGSALDIVGQTAMALAACHDAGLAHGAVTADHILVRPDATVALTGFAMPQATSIDADLDALRSLADTLSPGAAATIGAEPDAAGIGRAALAMAATTTKTPADVVPEEPRPPRPTPAEDAAEERADAERRRVRNRLIALGAIVVVFGAALLWFISRGANESTVPSVVNLPLSQAQNELIQAGFKGEAAGSSSSGATVTAQSPAAGTQVKDGSTITLTVSGGG